MGAFVKEAHQFKGVHGISEHIRPDLPDHIKEAMRAHRPAYTSEHAVTFTDGTVFPIQDGSQGQYLSLPSEYTGGPRGQVFVGEYVVQLHSGRFIKLNEPEFHDLGDHDHTDPAH